MKRWVMIGVMAVMGFCTAADAEMRIWTSKKGDTVEAEYLRMSGSKVVLKTAAGKTIHVPKAGLSDDDIEYLDRVNVVPPKIQIDVDDDLKREKKVLGYYREDEEQTITCNAVIRKTNREPCFEKFNASLYIIAEEAEGTKKRILGSERKEFSFTDSDSVELNVTGTAKNRVGYSWADGFEYEGYIVCVQDEEGNPVAVESNQNAYEKHVEAILKSRQGTEFNEDFVTRR